MIDQVTRREYLSEAFHSLSQPITALQCGLELAVAVPRTQKEYERRIGDALQNAANLRELVATLRELAEAEDSGEDAQIIEVTEFFSCIQNSLEKIAEAYEARLEVQVSHVGGIYASVEKLSRVLRFLTEEVITPNSTVHVSARRVQDEVEIAIENRGFSEEARGQKKSNERVREVRQHACQNYIATLGGTLNENPGRCTIALPVVSD